MYVHIHRDDNSFLAIWLEILLDSLRACTTGDRDLQSMIAIWQLLAIETCKATEGMNLKSI
jgi:hypothetical protein